MKSAQIVLIEDNPADVLLFKLALKKRDIPHVLTHFENGVAAVSTLCAERSLVPDAILLDLNTPLTDGFAALQQLQQFPALSEVPIAIFTSSRDQKDKDRASNQGARYIEKPSDLDEFLSYVAQSVEEMLASRRINQREHAS